MKYEITLKPMHSLTIQSAFRRARMHIKEMQKFAAEHNLESCLEVYEDSLQQMAEIDAIIDKFWDDLDVQGKQLVTDCKAMLGETNVTTL
jgi:hypothetical protein